MRLVLLLFLLTVSAATAAAGKLVTFDYQAECWAMGDVQCSTEVPVPLDPAKYRILSATINVGSTFVFNQWMENPTEEPSEFGIDTSLDATAVFAGGSVSCHGSSSAVVPLDPGVSYQVDFLTGCEEHASWAPDRGNGLSLILWSAASYSTEPNALQLVDYEQDVWAWSQLTVRAQEIPEPATAALCGTALLFLLARRLKRTSAILPK